MTCDPRRRTLPAQAHLTNLILLLSVKPLVYPARSNTLNNVLNSELTRKALEKVGNPNVLVNLISRRVRQLNSGSGALSRPLVEDPGHLGAADIALLEIIEEKVGFEMPEITELTRPDGQKAEKTLSGAKTSISLILEISQRGDLLAGVVYGRHFDKLKSPPGLPHPGDLRSRHRAPRHGS